MARRRRREPLACGDCLDEVLPAADGCHTRRARRDQEALRRSSASRSGCETFGQWPAGISFGSTRSRSRAIRRCQSGRIVRSSLATMYVEGISLVSEMRSLKAATGTKSRRVVRAQSSVGGSQWVQEALSNRGIGRGVLADPFRIEGRLCMLSHLFVEARVRIGHPGGEPYLVTSIEHTSCRRQQHAGAGMRDDDGLADAVDLSADDLCVLIRSEFRLVGWEIDRVRAVPTALERRNQALPARGRLTRAVDEDEVAQIARSSCLIRARAPYGSAPQPVVIRTRGSGVRSRAGQPPSPDTTASTWRALTAVTRELRAFLSTPTTRARGRRPGLHARGGTLSRRSLLPLDGSRRADLPP